jgi:hypothetical protein
MSRKKSHGTRLGVTPLEDRQTPSAGLAGPFAVGVPDGKTGDVVVYNADRSVGFTVTAPYGAGFTGGVRVALADVTGDGTPDLITAPGPGTEPLVKVYDGATHDLVASFDAYDPKFTGGVYVAAADLTGDGKAEIITGADQGGGPVVAVFDGSTVGGTAAPKALDTFLAIDDPNFRGGVRLATGDVNGDGTADLVVGAGFGGGPRVTVYDGKALGQGQQVKLVNDFFAFEASLRNGVFPAVGDLNGDGCGDLIFGAGPGGSPRVLAFDGRAIQAGVESAIANFFAGSAASRLGIEVGTVTDSSGNTTIVGTDLATDTAEAFAASGASAGSLAGDPGHQGCVAGDTDSDDGTGSTGSGSSSGSTTSGPIAVTTATATAVEGSYSGSGAGSLTTYTLGGTAPTTADATTNLTLDITGATLVYPPLWHRGSETTATTAYTLALTGNLTVSVNGAAATTVPFAGRFVLTADPAANNGAVTGVLHVTDVHTFGSSPMSDVHFNLEATLADGALTVDRVSVAQFADAKTLTVFRSPSSADAAKIVLTTT